MRDETACATLADAMDTALDASPAHKARVILHCDYDSLLAPIEPEEQDWFDEPRHPCPEQDL